MNKYVLISITLLVFIIGLGCASVANLHVADSTLSSGLGGNGDNGPFYATGFSGVRPLGTTVVDLPIIGNDGSVLADTARPGSDAPAKSQFVRTVRPESFDSLRPEVDMYTHKNRTPRGVADSNLGTGMGGGESRPYYAPFVSGEVSDNVVDVPIVLDAVSDNVVEVPILLDVANNDAISDFLPILGSGLGGGGNQNFY